MNNEITISVTKKDIAKGDNYCESCPIALAAKRRGFYDPFVTHDLLLYNAPNEYRGDNREYCRRLPESARQFAKDFDAGNAVKPFRFKLQIDKQDLGKASLNNNK